MSARRIAVERTARKARKRLVTPRTRKKTFLRRIVKRKAKKAGDYCFGIGDLRRRRRQRGRNGVYSSLMGNQRGWRKLELRGKIISLLQPEKSWYGHFHFFLLQMLPICAEIWYFCSISPQCTRFCVTLRHSHSTTSRIACRRQFESRSMYFSMGQPIVYSSTVHTDVPTPNRLQYILVCTIPVRT